MKLLQNAIESFEVLAEDVEHILKVTEEEGGWVTEDFQATKKWVIQSIEDVRKKLEGAYNG